MAKRVHVAAVRFQSEWARGRADAHSIVLEELDGECASLRGLGVDLVVFSEGVGAVAQTCAEAESITEPGALLRRYRNLAQGERCYVAGSVKLAEQGRVFNAVVYYGPDGRYEGAYRKTFPTVGEIESGISPGPGAAVLDTAIGRIGTLICFDLNFEELRRQYRSLQPDILVFASMFHGGMLQGVWVHECRAFFVCAWQEAGGGIVDPFGRLLAQTDCYHPIARAVVNLDRVLVHLDQNAEKFPAMERRYGEAIRIDIPAHLGQAIIYSESEEVSAEDMAREFGLEPLDAYLDRSRRRRVEAFRRAIGSDQEKGTGHE